jgi:hypothetical protein
MQAQAISSGLSCSASCLPPEQLHSWPEGQHCDNGQHNEKQITNGYHLTLVLPSSI